MSPDTSLWHRLGYILERAREGPAESGLHAARIAERFRGLRGSESERDTATRPRSSQSRNRPLPSTDQLLTAGLAAVAGRLLRAWPPRHPTAFGDLVKAGLCGAAAAVVVGASRPWLRDGTGGDGAEGEEAGTEGDGAMSYARTAWSDALAGAAQGLVYATVWEPRIPGPGTLKGALYGATEYAVTPLGGLSSFFGRATPQGRIPVLGRILDPDTGERGGVLEHLAFGALMGGLYGASPRREPEARSGMTDEGSGR